MQKWLHKALYTGFGLLFMVNSTMADMSLKKSSFDQLPGWKQDQQQEAIQPLQDSCKIIINKINYDQWAQSTQANAAWQASCKAILKTSTHPTTARARSVIQQWFTPYLVVDDGSSTGLFTGYYEPTIRGSLTKTKYFSQPIYARPPNLVKINLGKTDKSLKGKYGYRLKTKHGYESLPPRSLLVSSGMIDNAPILAWVHSDIDVFFMQIQGSGSIQLNNGEKILLGYDGQNSQPYYPIGRHLIEIGAIEKSKLSMQSIRLWLEAHPELAKEIMNLDPSYVFFKKLSTIEPLGSMGIPLYPSRSLAVDRQYIALGTLVWLDTYLPQATPTGVIEQGDKFQRLMVAQDTGGAIKGAIRADIFWGDGQEAQWLAGHMQSAGQYWLLLPKGLPNSKQPSSSHTNPPHKSKKS